MATSRPCNNHERESEYNDAYEKVSDDVEGGRIEPRSSIGSKEKEDPFGDESNSEIKYRTMAWW